MGEVSIFLEQEEEKEYFCACRGGLVYIYPHTARTSLARGGEGGRNNTTRDAFCFS
jgi:hypothetical protein